MRSKLRRGSRVRLSIFSYRSYWVVTFLDSNYLVPSIYNPYTMTTFVFNHLRYYSASHCNLHRPLGRVHAQFPETPRVCLLTRNFLTLATLPSNSPGLRPG